MCRLSCSLDWCSSLLTGLLVSVWPPVLFFKRSIIFLHNLTQTLLLFCASPPVASHHTKSVCDLSLKWQGRAYIDDPGDSWPGWLTDQHLSYPNQGEECREENSWSLRGPFLSHTHLRDQRCFICSSDVSAVTLVL